MCNPSNLFSLFLNVQSIQRAMEHVSCRLSEEQKRLASERRQKQMQVEENTKELVEIYCHLMKVEFYNWLTSTEKSLGISINICKLFCVVLVKWAAYTPSWGATGVSEASFNENWICKII